MCFGILPRNVELGLPNLAIGTNEDIQNTLAQLDAIGRAGEALQDLRREDSRQLQGFCDIVPMVAQPWLRQLGATINPYPRACPYTYGLTWYCVAYRALEDQLQRYNTARKATGRDQDSRPSARWVQKTYETLRKDFGDEWDTYTDTSTPRR